MSAPQEAHNTAQLFFTLVSHGGIKQHWGITENNKMKVEFLSPSSESLKSAVWAAQALGKVGLLKNPVDVCDDKKLAMPNDGAPLVLADNLTVERARTRLQLTFTPPSEVTAEELHGKLQAAELEARAAAYQRAGMHR